MFKLSKVSFSYHDKKVISNFSYKFKDNTRYVIIGKSGCGKSTLLNLLSGINMPDKGEVTLNDQLIKDISHNVGITFQKNSLFPWLTLEENYKLILDNLEEVKIIASKLDLEPYLDAYPNNLSGGQLQRANILKSLLISKDNLLFDEPTSSLDSFTKEMINKYLLKVFSSYNSTSIFVTHDIEEALLLGQIIIVMNDGKIIKEYKNKFYNKPDQKNKPTFYKEVIKLRSDIIWNILRVYYIVLLLGI
ncbi:MAG: ATP-binding cassette domain-containing protein [Mycoplasmatales bacterium]